CKFLSRNVFCERESERERERERDNNMQVVRGCFSPSCAPCALACHLSRSRCMPTELKQHPRNGSTDRSSCSTGGHCNIMHSPALPSSASSRPLSALFVFRNILNQGQLLLTELSVLLPQASLSITVFFFGAELIRSLHGYQVSEEEEWVEREFLFSPYSCIEMRAPIPRPILVASTAGDGGNGFLYRFKEGQSVGLWRCILAFDSTVAFSASSSPIPPLLCLSRNPRLKHIPTLLGDLQEAFQLRCEMDTKNTISSAPKGIQVCEGKESHGTAEYADTRYEDGSSDSCSTIRHVKLRNQKNHRTLQGRQTAELAISMKKKRAATEHVSNIALTDLVKYFNLPITEASKYLRVGLTVLKRKCREFGIPRWPHRKIKSLNNLIQNLQNLSFSMKSFNDAQEEVQRQEEENKSSAVKAVIKRQRMLEGEKECIEKNPFMELQIETKRFRQDVFKRRHRAKALLSKQDLAHLR
ncbi:hypothetical protein B296_00028183, partial [Ensete ventricosum]